MSTADDLPDDVVRRAAEAWFGRGTPSGWALNDARETLAEVIDAGIVALVPDPDTDAVGSAIEALDAALTTDNEQDYTDKVWDNLHAAGWTVARLSGSLNSDSTTAGGQSPNSDITDPCKTCDGHGRWPLPNPDAPHPDAVVLTERCDDCEGSGRQPKPGSAEDFTDDLHDAVHGRDCPRSSPRCRWWQMLLADVEALRDPPTEPCQRCGTVESAASTWAADPMAFAGECSDCGGSGRQPVASRAHDGPIHPVDLMASGESHVGVAGRPGDSRPVNPPPAGLPGDGWGTHWLRVEVTDVGVTYRHSPEGEWAFVVGAHHFLPEDLRPVTDAESSEPCKECAIEFGVCRERCLACGKRGNQCNMTSWNYDEEGLCCRSCTHPWATERSPDGWLRPIGSEPAPDHGFSHVESDSGIPVCHCGVQWDDEKGTCERQQDVLHPAPAPEPRPTDGWTVDVHYLQGVRWKGWWGWSVVDDTGFVVSHGRERTRAEAEAAAQAARTAWDTRLAGGAS